MFLRLFILTCLLLATFILSCGVQVKNNEDTGLGEGDGGSLSPRIPYRFEKETGIRGNTVGLEDFTKLCL